MAAAAAAMDRPWLRVLLWVTFALIAMWEIFSIWLRPTDWYRDKRGEVSDALDTTLFDKYEDDQLVYVWPILAFACLAGPMLKLARRRDQTPQQVAGAERGESHVWHVTKRVWRHHIKVPFIGLVTVAEVVLVFVILLGCFVVYYPIYQDVKSAQRYDAFDEKQKEKAGSRVDYMWERMLIYFALSATYTLTFSFVPLARGSPLLKLLNLPYEYAVRYHRWLNRVFFWFATIHAFGFWILWIKEGHLGHNIVQWAPEETSHGYLTGELAYLCLLVMFITSTDWCRRRYYNLFYQAHRLWIPMIVFLCMHYNAVAHYAYAGVSMYIIDKIIRYLQSTEIVSARISQAGADITQLEIDIDPAVRQRYRPLQIVDICVPAVSQMQFHPFTVSDVKSGSEGSTLTLFIKHYGKWTSRLHALAADAKGRDICVRVTGLYGLDDISSYSKSPHVLLVGGGIGITPLYSLLRGFARCSSSSTLQSISLVWAVRHKSETSRMLDGIQHAVARLKAKGVRAKAHVFVTRESGEEEGRGTQPVDLAIDVVGGSESKVRTSGQLRTPYSERAQRVNLSPAFYATALMGSYIGFLGLLALFVRLIIYPFENTSEEEERRFYPWVQGTIYAFAMFAGPVLVGGAVLLYAHGKERSVEGGKGGIQLDEEEEELCEGVVVGGGKEAYVEFSYGGRPNVNEILKDVVAADLDSPSSSLRSNISINNTTNKKRTLTVVSSGPDRLVRAACRCAQKRDNVPEDVEVYFNHASFDM